VKRVPILIPLLVMVAVLFIGILIFVYVQTKKANPQMVQTTSALRTHSQRAAHAGRPTPL